MLLGLGGVYVLISSFHDDDGDDDGEKYIYNLEQTYLARYLIRLKKHYLQKFLAKQLTTENIL